MAEHFLSDELLQALRRDRCKDLNDAQFDSFVAMVDRYKLDPFQNQIHAVLRNVKVKQDGRDVWEKRMTIQTGIDGFRLIADRSGAYAGSDDALHDSEESPRKATVTVWKMVNGVRCPFTASARWDQYYPGERQGQMWIKMPHVMLDKCAEALALRKAFPAELSGIYTNEEMAQADRANTDASAKAPEPPPEPAVPYTRDQALLEIKAATTSDELLAILRKIASRCSGEVAMELVQRCHDRMEEVIYEAIEKATDHERLDRLAAWSNNWRWDERHKKNVQSMITSRKTEITAP